MSRLARWAPVALLLGLEFWLSSQSSLPEPVHFENVDKLEHAGYFFVTALFALWAARKQGWSRGKAALTVILGTLAWGISDEYHQSFVPNRTAEVGDVLADVAGAALAAAAARAVGAARLNEN